MKLFYSLLLLFLLGSASWSQNSKELNTAAARAEKSAEVVRQFAALGADSVPVEYLKKAKAIAVFPGLTKVNILLSELTIGNGMFSFRSGDKWSVPVFLAFKGTDTNLKIAGKKSFDTVFLFMTAESVEQLKKGDLGFNSDSQRKAMLGPVIRGEETDRTLEQASLVYYTFDNGQLIDTNLSNDNYFKAFGILQDNNMNKSVFRMRTRDEPVQLCSTPKISCSASESNRVRVKTKFGESNYRNFCFETSVFIESLSRLDFFIESAKINVNTNLD